MGLFSPGDEQRISAAIADAERRTSGEIVVVVAAQSDGYHYVPPLVAAIVSLLVPWVLIFLTELGLVEIYLIQLAVFFIVTALLMPASVRIALVPSSIKHLHAHRRALEASGELTARRRQQARAWLLNLVEDGLREYLRSHPAVAGRIPLLEKEVEALRMTPAAAAREILGVLRGG